MEHLSFSNLPGIIKRNFPLEVRYELESMPLRAQQEFLESYGREMKVLGISYVCHALFGSSYLYQGKIFKQILFWLTAFGFGIGWIINLFRMPKMIRKVNYKIAMRIIRDIQRRYRYETQAEPLPQSLLGRMKAVVVETPRSVNQNYDPTNLTVENLKAGFLVDYELKTWEVVAEFQYDWFDGLTDRLFTLANDLEQVTVLLRKEQNQLIAQELKRINIYALNKQLPDEITFRKRPSALLHFQNADFFQEPEREGIFFDMVAKKGNQKVMCWEYFDQARRTTVRIEYLNDKEFKAFTGKLISPLSFSEILPKKTVRDL
jgi:hypothetical protein